MGCEEGEGSLQPPGLGACHGHLQPAECSFCSSSLCHHGPTGQPGESGILSRGLLESQLLHGTVMDRSGHFLSLKPENGEMRSNCPTQGSPRTTVLCAVQPFADCRALYGGVLGAGGHGGSWVLPTGLSTSPVACCWAALRGDPCRCVCVHTSWLRSPGGPSC